MGRLRKHPELERIEGNPGNRPFDELLLAAEGSPFAPDHLSDEAAAALDIIVRSMPPAVYARADSFMLAAFVIAWDLHKRSSPCAISRSSCGHVRARS